MELAAIIRELGRGATGSRDLSQSEAQKLYAAMLDGKIPDLELGAIAIALRMKTETLAEMAGFLAAANAALPQLLPSTGNIRPLIIPSYNGARRSVNLTPLLALLAQRMDIPVLVHGIGDGFARISSEAILQALGLPICSSPAEAQYALETARLAYLPLSVLSPGLARQLALRARLGLRNTAHSLVKMIDPFAGAGLLLAAATHPAYLTMMRALLKDQGAHALLLRGSEGEPFANPKRRPMIEHLHDGQLEVLCEAEHDSLLRLPSLPASCDVATTVGWIRDVLAGHIPVPGPIAHQLACCLFASGRARTLFEAKTLAGVHDYGPAPWQTSPCPAARA